ncbi:MAG: GTP cyclohydrolase II [Planctomycetota bacterium]|nr:GTP cyclohydrolase II [Planctomycetota bacterium]MDA1180260.1 GTP cyclohydrolase II [Planctomycetota bacterium]
MSGTFSTIEEAVDAIARGELVIVLDDEDRENEGDFVCAAGSVTPEQINIMIRDGRGLVCATILPETAERLKLPPMTLQRTDVHRTAFTVTVDHRTARTGITAMERATTIRALADPHTQPSDFVLGGHVHALVAKPGGVLRRAGHTEASIDLIRMAGLEPCGVVCEILDEEGDRASRELLLEIARRKNLAIITIEELIRYRRRHERLVQRDAEAKLPTQYGPCHVIAYSVQYESQQPVVLVMGNLSSVDAPLVRLHSSCFTGDLLASLRCDCGDQLHMAMQMISDEGVGVLVYLPQEGRGIGLTQKIKAYALQDQGLDTVEANLALGHKADMRDYGVGIQILKDLGLSRVRLLTNNPKKTDAFIYGGFELEVVGQVPISVPSNEHNRQYLKTKQDKLGHQFNLSSGPVNTSSIPRDGSHAPSMDLGNPDKTST